MLTLLLATSCLGAPTGQDRSLLRLQEAGRMLVAIDPTYPPFANDEHGQPVGYDVDLARLLAGKLGIEVVFVPIDVGSIHDAVIANRADLAISALPVYPELSSQIGHSRPYFNAGQAAIARVGTPIRLPEGLADRIVAVEAGTAADLELRREPRAHRPGQLRLYDSPASLAAALEQGEAELAVADVVTALELAREHRGLQVLGPSLTFEPYVVALRRRDGALRTAVDQALAQLDAEGASRQLADRWLPGLPTNW